MWLVSLVAAAALSCAPAAPAVTEIDIDALLGLRDLSGLSLSPDGRQVAFQIQQADESADRYRSSWCALDIETARVRTLGEGGDIIMPILPGRERRTGMWSTLAARWSPDSRAIAVLARHDAAVGIDVCDVRRARCRTILRTDGDVEDLAWSADGRGLLYRARPGASRIEAARAREGDRGYRLDERFDVFHALHPLRGLTIPEFGLRYVDLRTGRTRPASSEEIGHFEIARPTRPAATLGTGRSYSVFAAAPSPAPGFLAGRDMRGFARTPDGAIWTEPAFPDLAGAAPPLQLWASRDGGQTLARCESQVCIGRIVEFAAIPGGEVLFIRREGWGESRHALYIWNIDRNEAAQIWSGEEVVRACAPRAAQSICLMEGPIAPRRIVAIDHDSGALRTLYDPNPELTQEAFIPAQKRQWRTPLGDEVFGYLLIPEGQAPWPLIVVQYRALGFLRGGVGDEYPIQAFARAGFAVLALERPDPFALRARERSADEIDRLEWSDLSERWRTLAALTSGIETLVREGLVDGARVGVTGLSDGAETAAFALIHCKCIAAAALSSGVHDPSSLYFASDAERRSMRLGGRGENGELWPSLSLSRNAADIETPILAQVADREALFMLQAHRTFTDLGRPFDLYIFPDEYHVKWRPRHRRAIYQRSLAWFAFWLQQRELPLDPAAEPELARWRHWRDQSSN